MTFILFHGLSSSKYYWTYDDNRNNIDIVKYLEKMGNVFNHTIPYNNIMHYDNKCNLYDKIDTIDINDLPLNTYITKMYKQMDKSKYPPPYIIICHSHGIYYGIEFARQYGSECKYMFALDPVYITKKMVSGEIKEMMDETLINIKSQDILDNLVVNIKYGNNKDLYIKRLFDYIQLLHKLYCINNNFEQLPVPTVIFYNYDPTLKNV